jgi:hypothetical protein
VRLQHAGLTYRRRSSTGCSLSQTPELHLQILATSSLAETRIWPGCNEAVASLQPDHSADLARIWRGCAQVMESFWPGCSEDVARMWPGLRMEASLDSLGIDAFEAKRLNSKQYSIASPVAIPRLSLLLLGSAPQVEPSGWGGARSTKLSGG